MTSLPRASRQVLSPVAVRGCALVAVLAGSSFFSWSCQGEVAQGGPVDAGNRADDGGVTTAEGASNDGGLPACTWLASFDDAAPQQCSAARAYVACQDGDRCMSSDPTTCPGEPGASCIDVCNPNEYAIGCSGAGPASPLLAGCRGVFSGNGGPVGCCPCGTNESVNDGGTLRKDAGQDCTISASSYDQSCTVDTDCQEVTSTDYCTANCLCGGSAINVGAVTAFNEAIGKTPLGSGTLSGGCPCPSSFGPCCRGGTCTTTCLSPSDTLPSCADAGGSCLLSRPSGVTCTMNGPPDACAYSDEVCCL
jgi:hypothetical protein